MSDIAAVFLFILIVISLFVVGLFANFNGYKQGQIDAINGIVKYELKTNPDKTTRWEKKETK